MRNLVFVVLCAIVFIIPWQEMAIFASLNVTLARFLGYFALGFAPLAILASLSMRRIPAALLALAFVLFWNWLSLLWSICPSMTQEYAITCTALFLLAWMVWEFSPGLRHVQWLMQSYLLGCVFSLAMLLATFVTGYKPRGAMYARYSGGGMNANEMGLLLVIAIPIAVYLASMTSRKGSLLRKVYWVMVPAAGLGVFLTGSRTAVAALVIEIIMMFLLRREGGWKGRLLLTATVLFAAVLIAEIVPTVLLNRVGETVTREETTSTLKRREELWTKGLDHFVRTPAVGIGAGAYSFALTGDPTNRWFVAHNVFIGILVDEGVIGFAAYVIALVLIVRAAWRMPKAERSLWLPVLAAWGACAMTLSLEYAKVTWLIYSLILVNAEAPRRPSAVRAMVGRRWPSGARLRRPRPG